MAHDNLPQPPRMFTLTEVLSALSILQAAGYEGSVLADMTVQQLIDLALAQRKGSVM